MVPEAPLAATAEGVARLIHRRKVGLRTLVLALPALFTLAAVLALAGAPWMAAASLVLPSWFAYLLADTLCVGAWRRRIHEEWLAGRTNLGVLAGAFATGTMLPQATVKSLLRTVPVLAPVVDRDLTPEARNALASFADWRWAEETTAGLLPNVILGIASLAMLLPLGGVPFVSALAALLALIVALRLLLPAVARRRFRRAMLALPDEAARLHIAGLAAGLDWEGPPAPRRRRLLAAFEVRAQPAAGAIMQAIDRS